MTHQGLIHIYCGDGKGKTTAALGQAVRSAGRGMPVVIARFLKQEDSGEVEILKHIPGIQVISCTRSFGFSWTMTPEERRQAEEYYGQMLEQAFALAPAGEKGLLVLDEGIGAAAMGFISEDRLIQLLDERQDQLEVILTGRGPSKALLDRGDYITEMKALRHPYEKGISAREGIEY